MAWIPIKKILPRSVREHGIRRSVDASAIVECANSILGATGNAVSFRAGYLKISCRSPVFAQEIRLNESELLSKLHRQFPSLSEIRLKFMYADDTLEE